MPTVLVITVRRGRVLSSPPPFPFGTLHKASLLKKQGREGEDLCTAGFSSTLRPTRWKTEKSLSCRISAHLLPYVWPTLRVRRPPGFSCPCCSWLHVCNYPAITLGGSTVPGPGSGSVVWEQSFSGLHRWAGSLGCRRRWKQRLPQPLPGAAGGKKVSGS